MDALSLPLALLPPGVLVVGLFQMVLESSNSQGQLAASLPFLKRARIMLQDHRCIRAYTRVHFSH